MIYIEAIITCIAVIVGNNIIPMSMFGTFVDLIGIMVKNQSTHMFHVYFDFDNEDIINLIIITSNIIPNAYTVLI